eukprot:403361586
MILMNNILQNSNNNALLPDPQNNKNTNSYQYQAQLQNTYLGMPYSQGPQLKYFPYENVQQATNLNIKEINIKHRKDERTQLIKAGFDNLQQIGVKDPKVSYYNKLGENSFKINRSAVTTPVRGQILLPEIAIEDPYQSKNNRALNNTSILPNTERNINRIINQQQIKPFSATERYKNLKQQEQYKKDLERKDYIKRKQQVEDYDQQQKNALKYHFKQLDHDYNQLNKTTSLQSNQISKDDELERDFDDNMRNRLKPTNAYDLTKDAKKLNIKLRDFVDNQTEVFQMQSIIDVMLRKVCDCILSRRQFSKKQSEIAETNKVDPSYYITSKYQDYLQRSAQEFWSEILTQKQKHLYEYIRWDIFEENLVIFLLDHINLSSQILDRINWKLFMTFVLKECADYLIDNDEVVLPASDPGSMMRFKNSIRELYDPDIKPLSDQYKCFKDTVDNSSHIAQLVGSFALNNQSYHNYSLYRYCDGSWYRGPRAARKRHGKGKLQFSSGELYEGEFLRGLRHGYGHIGYYQNQKNKSQLDQKNICMYKGEFRNDLKEGQATIEFADGSRFHGSFRANQQYYGTYIWPPDNKDYPDLSQREYTGYWQGHLMQGQGILSEQDQVKTGVFKESKLHGTGIQQKLDGQIALRGDFTNDILNGDLCEIESENGRYFGQIENGVINGQGQMIYKNGDKYQGIWKDGRFHGKGKYYFTNGSIYYGNWAFGMRNGHGLEVNDDEKQSYEGMFQNDTKHGFGIQKATIIIDSHNSNENIHDTYNNQATTKKERYIEYSGNFNNNKKHGQGKLIIYTNSNKSVVIEFYEGNFSEGVKKGIGRQVKLREGQESRLEREYEEFIGDFYGDKPIMSSGNSKVIINFHI